MSYPSTVFAGLCSALIAGTALSADFQQVLIPQNVGVAVEPSHRGHALTDSQRKFQLPRRESVWLMMEAPPEPAVMNPDAVVNSTSSTMDLRRTPVLVHFGFNDTEPLSTKSLGEVLGEATKSGVEVKVIGHADETGTDRYNQGLSERRAKAVASWLTQAGIPAASIQAEGRGKREPLDPSDPAKNRRVSIQLFIAEGKK